MDVSDWSPPAKYPPTTPIMKIGLCIVTLILHVKGIVQDDSPDLNPAQCPSRSHSPILREKMSQKYVNGDQVALYLINPNVEIWIYLVTCYLVSTYFAYTCTHRRRGTKNDIDEQLDEVAEFRCRLTEQMLTLQKDYDNSRQREAWQRSQEMDRNRRIRKPL